jgi:hypothetical protein
MLIFVESGMSVKVGKIGGCYLEEMEGEDRN